MNQTLLQRARCMRLNVGLSKEFWAEAVNTVAYLVNKSPSTAIDLKTPQEVWSGLAKNPVYHERSKHIDVRLNFIRDVIEDKLFSIEKIATIDNPADMLTKPLSFEKFKHSLDLVNVCIA
uniref:Retrovirus-related Pol polyprotein from transposon TNT 1-94 n=1 Tax=Cajanus cajan TaxID=3821 RepID=A0A151U1P2_CAJCA|nr:Retrovirus-related Pol polyprotein from transposon TNT 1-94 [Cajanus cajan]KYP73239.1 Retrovirus-related Pol polyprotein from transposon TNT 1-94 [Cajanus cajan]